MNYVLQGLLSKFLKKYLSNFESECLLMYGEASFSKVALKEQSFNPLLKSIANLNFIMTKGVIDEVKINIPWS